MNYTIEQKKYLTIKLKNGKTVFIPTNFKIENLESSLDKNYLILWDRSKKKYGVINSDSKIIVDFNYDSIEPFEENILKTKQGDYVGLIKIENGRAREIVPCNKYTIIYSFSEGKALVFNQKIEKCGYIDKEGNEVIKCKFEGADAFSEGLAAICITEAEDTSEDENEDEDEDEDIFEDDGNELLAFINQNGEIVLKTDYPWNQYGFKFDHGLCLIYDDLEDAYYCINREGKKVTEYHKNIIIIDENLLFFSDNEYNDFDGIALDLNTNQEYECFHSGDNGIQKFEINALNKTILVDENGIVTSFSVQKAFDLIIKDEEGNDNKLHFESEEKLNDFLNFCRSLPGMNDIINPQNQEEGPKL